MGVGEKYGGKVGGKVIKQRKLLQLRTGSEKASWGKREKKEEVAPIADRKRKSELEKK